MAARPRPLPARIRRRRAAAVALAVTLLAGLAVALISGGEEEPPAPAAGLGPAELAGQRVIAGFDGARPPARLVRMIRSGRLAGVILFEDNLPSPERARRLTARLQSIRRDGPHAAPLLVMTDQEGGEVMRLEAPPSVAAAELAAQGPQAVRAEGLATGRALLGVGINVDLAPVLDVARPGGAIESERRAYGSDPEAVSGLGLAFAEGLREAGVAATAKHFPGLGAARRNTDLAAQTIALGGPELRVIDAAPFEAFVDAGGELVMTSLARYPALSRRPAAFAREVVEGELRERIGFGGVVITDSLAAAAARAFGSDAKVARAAAEAGNDLLLYTDPRAAANAHRVLARELRRDPALRPAYETAATRVLELRAALGGP